MCRLRYRVSKKQHNPWQEKAAAKMATAAIRLQQNFSRVMNGLFSDMPSRRIKIILVLFILVSSGYSIYLAAYSVFGAYKNDGSVKPGSLHTPIQLEQNEKGTYIPTQRVSGEFFQQLQEYKRYMDSVGQPIRQGLWDSIRMLEEIYHAQTKK